MNEIKNTCPNAIQVAQKSRLTQKKNQLDSYKQKQKNAQTKHDHNECKQKFISN